MTLAADLDRILRQATDAGDVPGVAVTITDRDGTRYEGASGERALGGGADMTVDTVGWIASMTKALTGAAAMQLVEQGRLDLDAPATDVVVDLGACEVLTGWSADGRPQPRPPVRPVTLRHLLTHSAGFAYEIWSADVARFQEATGRPGITTCENAALQMPLLFDPGEQWQYGINIDWAGKMVEAVSGQRLGAYMAANLFEPMGMTSTGFALSTSMRERLSGMHARAEDGSLVPMEFGMPEEPEFEMGGGGLYSNVTDYLAFVRTILNGGRCGAERVLAPETVRQMSVNNMGECRVGLLRTAAPPLSNDAEFFPGVEKTWGLSFQINEAPAPTGRPAGGLMWAGLANSYYWIDPTNGIGGVYLTQILPFADVKSLPLYLEVESTVYRNR